MTQLTKDEGTEIRINGILYSNNYTESLRGAAYQSYVDTATKYLLQLKSERERAGKLLELLADINKSLYVGEDLKDGEILDWYMRVIDTIKGEIETAITEYKNNNQ